MVIDVIGSFIAACLFDLVIDCLVCMVLFFLRFWFLFWFWFLPACLLFVPVHEWKRAGRLKPATVVHFFPPVTAVHNSHRSMSEVTSMLLLLKSKHTVTVNIDRHFELAGSTFMSSVDNHLPPTLCGKGNATVTFDGLKLHKRVVCLPFSKPR